MFQKVVNAPVAGPALALPPLEKARSLRSASMSVKRMLEIWDLPVLEGRGGRAKRAVGGRPAQDAGAVPGGLSRSSTAPAPLPHPPVQLHVAARDAPARKRAKLRVRVGADGVVHTSRDAEILDQYVGGEAWWLFRVVV